MESADRARTASAVFLERDESGRLVARVKTRNVHGPSSPDKPVGPGKQAPPKVPSRVSGKLSAANLARLDRQ